MLLTRVTFVVVGTRKAVFLWTLAVAHLHSSAKQEEHRVESQSGKENTFLVCVCDHLKGSHRDFTSSKSIQMGFVKTHLSCPLQVLTEPNHGKNDVNRTKYLNHTMNLKKRKNANFFYSQDGTFQLPNMSGSEHLIL